MVYGGHSAVEPRPKFTAESAETAEEEKEVGFSAISENPAVRILAKVGASGTKIGHRRMHKIRQRSLKGGTRQ